MMESMLMIMVGVLTSAVGAISMLEIVFMIMVSIIRSAVSMFVITGSMCRYAHNYVEGGYNCCVGDSLKYESERDRVVGIFIITVSMIIIVVGVLVSEVGMITMWVIVRSYAVGILVDYGERDQTCGGYDHFPVMSVITTIAYIVVGDTLNAYGARAHIDTSGDKGLCWRA